MSNPRRFTTMTGAMALLALLAGTAMAANAPREHDRGFFLRMSAGAGAASTKIEGDLGGDLKFSGAAGDANFAIGALVSKNLAVHGTFWGWSMSNPDFEYNNTDGTTENATVTMSAFGPGLTWYMGPSNFYLSGAVGAASLSMDKDLPGGGNLSGDSDTGVAVDLTLGKEWWVGNRWGLGAALGFGYHNIPPGDADNNFKGTSLGIRFSATFN